MQSMKDDSVAQQVVVRTYRPEDQPMVYTLYTDGLLAGQIAPNDTGADIDNIQEAYFDEPTSHFWVAELQNEVLGMIGVAWDHQHTAEIRRLRVHADWQNTPIGGQLLERALEHCKIHGLLKVVLDTRFDPDSVMDLFDRFGFQHTRSKELHGKDLLEFYLDLYRQTKSEDSV